MNLALSFALKLVRRPRYVLAMMLAGWGAASVATAQTFVNNTTQIPAGAPFNNSYTENVDFADVDGDGDFDAMWADGGDQGNDLNRLWINQGGLQNGTVGFFIDETATRLPTGTDASRDVDFVDIDSDSDFDVLVSNSSSTSNQGNRWLVNQGGVQGGTPGYFTDETSIRWVNVGVNNASTAFSSVSPMIVFGSGLFEGSFVDWSCDSVFADLDNDGDMDLVHTSYGASLTSPGEIPSRIFLNDEDGHFEEYNPSGFQLPSTDIENGDPGLWCDGVHQQGTQVVDGSECDIADTPLGVEIGDLDGDLDLDILQGAVRELTPRIFANLLDEGGGVGFRDETFARFAEMPPFPTDYEQELGDLDNDDDLDLYVLNWTGGYNDAIVFNDGSGSFGAKSAISATNSADDEADIFDCDGDGDLDVFVCSLLGQKKLLTNQGPPLWTFSVSSPALPGKGIGCDACDVDQDGDYDIFLACIDNLPNVFGENVTEMPDVTAPRITAVEQATDRCPSTFPTVVRAHVYDNSSWDITQYNSTRIDYQVDGGPVQSIPMSFSGGQVWRGELPGSLSGSISYSVRSTDEHGNTGVSGASSFTTSSVVSYCTAGVSALGCQALLDSTGTPSASSGSGFVVHASGVEGQKPGLFFFGTSGQTLVPWGNGTSFKCVLNPVNRGALLQSSGSAGSCGGAFAYDLNARWEQQPAQNPGPGALVQVQLWYRDPLNTSNQPTAFSDALELTVCP